MSPSGIGFPRYALFFFFALFAFCSTFSIAASQMAFGAALLLFFWIAVRERHQLFVQPLRWFHIFVALYVIWLFISAALGATPVRSMFILKEEWLFLIVPVGIYLFRSEKYSDWLLLSLAGGLCIVSVYGIIQHFTGAYWFLSRTLHTVDVDIYRISGFFSHPLTFGNYMAVATLFLLGYTVFMLKEISTWRRVFLLSAGFLALVVTALCNSRGPSLALGTGLVVLGLMCRKMHYALIALIAIIIFGLTASPGIVERFRKQFHIETQLRYEGGRFFIWNNSLKIIRDHPVLGVGQGNFRDEYITHLRADIGEHRKMAHAHSDYLNVAAIAGIPGLLLYLGVWGSVILCLWRGYMRRDFPLHHRGLCLAAFLASLVFMVSSLTEATFADEEVRQLAMFIWAAGLSVWYRESTPTV